MKRLWNEPALISGLINAGMLALLTFGFAITDEQMMAVMGFVNAALAVIVRTAVVPNALAEERVEKGYRPTESEVTDAKGRMIQKPETTEEK